MPNRPSLARAALLLALLPLSFDTVLADEDLAQRIESWLEPAVSSGHVAGCLLVADEGEVVYEGCFGMSNYELDVPNGPQTRFGIASITKPLQLILAARLQDAGAFSLEDTLSRWLPDFPLADSTLVLDLANHTAGIPHRVTEPHEECVPRTAADMVQLVVEKGLDEDQRGERRYSSAGYSVFARVLELAGGDDWPSLMSEYVFEPAGMTHTVHPGERRLVPGRASSYSRSFDGLTNAPPKDLSFLVGAGSLFATPRDLWRALDAVDRGLFGQTARDWVVRDRENFSWSGRTNAYRAICEYDTTRRRAVIFCANVETGVVSRLGSEIPKLLDGEEVEPLPRFDQIEVVERSESELRGFEGRYELGSGTILDVTARGGSLFANEWEMVPLGGDRFFSVRDFNDVRFVRDDAGVILRMDWGGGDTPYAVPRVGDLRRSVDGG